MGYSVLHPKYLGSVGKVEEKIKDLSEKVGNKKQSYISCCNYCFLVVTVLFLQ